MAEEAGGVAEGDGEREALERMENEEMTRNLDQDDEQWQESKHRERDLRERKRGRVNKNEEGIKTTWSVGERRTIKRDKLGRRIKLNE